MAWTIDTAVQEWIKGVDLGIMPLSFDQSIIDAEVLLRARISSFVSSTIVASWIDATDTPPLVQQWAARMAGALYLARVLNYQLIQSEPNNPAAYMYADVMAEIQNAEYGKVTIYSIAGSPIAISGPTINTVWRDVDELPISAGGNEAG